MPLYEYSCKNCGHEFSAMRSIAERKQPESEACSECGEMEINQLISAAKISYSNPGSMKHTESFKDRVREIKKNIPKRYHDNLSNIV